MSSPLTILLLLLFRQDTSSLKEETDKEEEEESEEETAAAEEEEEEGSIPDDVLIEKSDPKDWVLLTEGDRKRRPNIEQIPYQPRYGEDEDFDICLSIPELEQIKDEHGDIRYEKVHEFLLPEIDGVKYYAWLAAG